MYVRPVAASMTHRDCTQKNCICIDTTSRYSERQFPVSPAVAYMVWEREHDRVYCHSRKAIGTALGIVYDFSCRCRTLRPCKFKSGSAKVSTTYASLYGKQSHRIICTGSESLVIMIVRCYVGQARGKWKLLSRIVNGYTSKMWEGGTIKFLFSPHQHNCACYLQTI